MSIVALVPGCPWSVSVITTVAPETPFPRPVPIKVSLSKSVVGGCGLGFWSLQTTLVALSGWTVAIHRVVVVLEVREATVPADDQLVRRNLLRIASTTTKADVAPASHPALIDLFFSLDLEVVDRARAIKRHTHEVDVSDRLPSCQVHLGLRSIAMISSAPYRLPVAGATPIHPDLHRLFSTADGLVFGGQVRRALPQLLTINPDLVIVSSAGFELVGPGGGIRAHGRSTGDIYVKGLPRMGRSSA